MKGGPPRGSLGYLSAPGMRHVLRRLARRNVSPCQQDLLCFFILSGRPPNGRLGLQTLGLDLTVRIVKQYVIVVLTENLVQFQLLTTESISFPTEHPRFSRHFSI